MKFRARVWTGPTGVQSVAEKFREAGISVHLEGTEHIYIDIEASEPAAVGHNLQATMMRCFGNGWWWIERATSEVIPSSV